MGEACSHLLLIDDDRELAALLADYLGAEGYRVSQAHDGDEGLVLALTTAPDLVILDVSMPGLDGLALLRRLRAASAVPVLMLTARGEPTDRIVGLELGADDYVPKPCLPRELAARARAILKRSAPPRAAECLRVGALALWPGQRRAELAGRALSLTGSEFAVLVVLARHAGVPVSKDTLAREALGRPLARFERSIDMHVSGIRAQLGSFADGRSPIQTVVRQGYQLVSA